MENSKRIQKFLQIGIDSPLKRDKENKKLLPVENIKYYHARF
jgi:hypothetical protein